MTEKSDKTDPPAEKGRRGFQPGVSGNPKGRPRGSRNRTTLQLETILAEHGEDVIEQLLALALRDGDRVALKLCLERLLPPLKSRPLTFALPEIATASDIVTAQQDVFQALAKGQLCLDEAERIVALLDAHRRAIDTVDQAERLSRVEQELGLD